MHIKYFGGGAKSLHSHLPSPWECTEDCGSVEYLFPPVQDFSILKVIPIALWVCGPVGLCSPISSLTLSTALRLSQPFSLHFYVLCRAINLPFKVLYV